MASRLATAIYVAMVTSILYDNSYNRNDSNLTECESYRSYGCQTLAFVLSSIGEWQLLDMPPRNKTRFLDALRQIRGK